MNQLQRGVLLDHQIALIRKQLDELIENSSMTSAVVLKLSRKLDRLILSYYRFNSKSRIPDELSVTLKKYHVGK